MKIEGILEKSKSYWSASVPLLFVYTQGKSKKMALSMVQDAIECLIEDKKFEVKVQSKPGSSTFNIHANNESKLMAFILKQQRLYHGLSIRDVVARLGFKSPTAYSRYEKGEINPGLEKFSKMLQAINNDLELILKAG